MAITIPTVDEFTESTVMLVIREIAEYICGNNGLVAQINNNDITGFTSSYTDNVLKIDATKGDGSKLPVCNVTIEGGGSSTGNPYPTAVSGTVGVDGNIKFTITMSSGSPLTTTINMNHFASTADLSDLQERVTGLKLSTSNNNITLNGDSVQIVKTVSGTVSNGNLQITVNGVSSGDIPLPESVITYHIQPIVSNKITYYRDEFDGYCMVYKVNDINSEAYNFSVPNSFGHNIIVDKVFINGITTLADTTLHLYKINYRDYASILTEAGYNTLPDGDYDIGLSVVEPFSTTDDVLVIGKTMNERVSIRNGVLNKINDNDAYIFSTKNNLENTNVTLIPYIIVRGS